MCWLLNIISHLSCFSLFICYPSIVPYQKISVVIYITISYIYENLIDKAELEDLREKVNPKRFINPYNAEKVSLANELYATLVKENLTYGELIEVKEKSKLL